MFVQNTDGHPALLDHSDQRRFVEELRTERNYAVNEHCSLFVNRKDKLTFRICVNIDTEHEGVDSPVEGSTDSARLTRRSGEMGHVASSQCGRCACGAAAGAARTTL